MDQSARKSRKKRNVILHWLRAGWYKRLRTKPAGALSLEEKVFLRKYKNRPNGFGSCEEECYEEAV